MVSFLPFLLIIAVAVPLFDVVYTKTGDCPPMKLLSVNSCKVLFILFLCSLYLVLTYS